MPTEFIAQNGATFDQATNIGVTGCPKAVHKAAKKRSKGKRGRKGGK